MSQMSRYKCLVYDYDADNVDFCKIIRINIDHVSEVVEIGEVYLRFPERLYDEAITFLFGKKIVLFEKNNKYVSREDTGRVKMFCEEIRCGHFYVKIKHSVNKLIMSNGNQYYVLAE